MLFLFFRIGFELSLGVLLHWKIEWTDFVVYSNTPGRGNDADAAQRRRNKKRKREARRHAG
jgi:hypothetical protein